MKDTRLQLMKVHQLTELSYIIKSAVKPFIGLTAL